MLIRVLFFPILGVSLSIIIGQRFFKKYALLLFLLLLALYDINTDFTSLRHLIPEMGLVFLTLGLQKTQEKPIIIGSILIGLAVWCAPEYALIASLSTGVLLLIKYCQIPSRQTVKSLIAPVIIIGSLAGLFILYLLINHSLGNFIKFYTQYSASFYTLSPTREAFPRFNDLGSYGVAFPPTETSFSTIHHTWQKINLYLVPLTLGELLLLSLAKKKFTNLPYILFSLLAYYRILSTPGSTYLSYGMLFLFLVLIRELLEQKSRQLKKVLALIIVWFLLSANRWPEIIAFADGRQKFNEYKQILDNRYLSTVGIALPSSLQNEYLEIADYIAGNTTPQDTIFVYPNGPYYQLAKRSNATTISSISHYDFAPFLESVVVNELQTNPPQLIIINQYNAERQKTLLSGLDYAVVANGENVIFKGLTSPVENYISQNYKLIKKNQLAWILKKRDQPIPLIEYWHSATNQPVWQIVDAGSEAVKSLNKNQTYVKIAIPEKALPGAAVKIPVKVAIGWPKTFSKYIISAYASFNSGNLQLGNLQYATGNWQDVWITLPEGLAKEPPINSLVLSVSENKGFSWWGKPKEFQIGSITIYTKSNDY